MEVRVLPVELDIKIYNKILITKGLILYYKYIKEKIMRRWNDLYNMGNDYPQYIIRNKKPSPVPPTPEPIPEEETDIELGFGENKLIIKLDELSKEEISKVEVTIEKKV